MMLLAIARETIQMKMAGRAKGGSAEAVHAESHTFGASLRRFLGTHNEGGSLVEFALVLPMMMVLMTGMFSVGVALNNYIVLTDGVAAGARAFALARGQNGVTDPCAYAVQMMEASSPSLNSSGITFAMSWTTSASGSAVTANYTNSCSGITLASGDNIQMQATYPVPLIMYGWAPATLHIIARSSEMVQ